MKVWELEEKLRLLVKEGKGDYEVFIAPTLFEENLVILEVDPETKTVII